MKLTESFNRSLWVFHLNTGSCNGCEIEIVATITPRYDPERFGIKLVGSPKHADVLLVTGPVTKKMAPKARRVYEQVPIPSWSCASGPADSQVVSSMTRTTLTGRSTRYFQ